MMKRWTRAILAVLLGALALGYLGTVPAEATKPAAESETVVAYRGYTISWSEADASDVRILRTPGRSESFPAEAIDRSIRQAKSRVASAEQQLSEAPTDACNFVPDTFGDADFSDACLEHDVCYSNNMQISRLACDLAFFAALSAACLDAYRLQPALLLTCNTVASIYFVGVRLFGGFFYTGNGNPV